MASTHIEIGGSRLGNQARGTVDSLYSAFDQLQKFNNILQSVATGNDWTSVETALGLQPGQGQTAYNLISGAYATMNVSAVTNMLNELG